METKQLDNMFSSESLERLFSADRADSFFEALYGDADEGAYDISLGFSGRDADTLKFELQLRQRPGKCLACNLTHGLPEVFSRHPIIDIRGLVQEIGRLLGSDEQPKWKLGRTREKSRELHVVPLDVSLTKGCI